MKRLAIDVIVFLAVCAIVWAFITYAGIPIPWPLMIVVYAVLAILAIIYLFKFANYSKGE